MKLLSSSVILAKGSPNITYYIAAGYTNSLSDSSSDTHTFSLFSCYDMYCDNWEETKIDSKSIILGYPSSISMRPPSPGDDYRYPMLTYARTNGATG